MSEGETKAGKKRDTNWAIVLWYLHLHVFSVYGIWLIFSVTKWMTIFFTMLLISISYLGITVGAHRLWAHRTYTASWYVRFFLMLAHTMAGVGPIYNWVLAHRAHHKFYGTDKDPYNHKKGLWYSHVVGNFLMRHPDQEEINRAIDMRDMDSDGVVWFQRRFYWILFVLIAMLVPINTPAEYWGESLKTSLFVVGCLRLTITAHILWLVNSSLLVWGLGEKDKFPPDDNYIFFLNRTFWPRYHYLMPWDWKSGEYGTYETGFGTLMIKIWYELNLVSKLLTNTPEEVQAALYTLASKRSTLTDTLSDLRVQAEKMALKDTFRYRH